MPDLDHGSLKDDWDTYVELFGSLPFHVQKLDRKTLGDLDRLIEIAVRRGTPITRDELVTTAYQHPIEGLFH